MNDPNGMLYYKGTYHLFYQYFPNSTVWGPMHWGHATSTDLVHWQHKPIALYPDSLGYIFSGSIVVDENNTSGLQVGQEKPLVALFTYHNDLWDKQGRNDFQTQGMAYSVDKGATWVKYAHNPVLKNPGKRDFRDPKVFWHQPSRQWIMTLAVADHVEFYQSPNLIDWKYASSFGKEEGNHGGVWECPDLMQIKIEGSNEYQWVLLVSVGTGAPNGGSGTQYFVGKFDGNQFKNKEVKEQVKWLDYGPDNYAGVTWSNEPKGRHLFLGWMSNWDYAQKVPTNPWRSAMTIPRVLTLKIINQQLQIVTQPAKELLILRGKKIPLISFAKKTFAGSSAEVLLNFDTKGSLTGEYGITLSNDHNEMLKVGYSKVLNQFFIDRSKAGTAVFTPSFASRHTAPRIATNDMVKLHLFIDHSSVELFADDGTVLMTSLFFPTNNFKYLQPFAINSKTRVLNGEFYQLKTIW